MFLHFSVKNAHNTNLMFDSKWAAFGKNDISALKYWNIPWFQNEALMWFNMPFSKKEINSETIDATFHVCFLLGITVNPICPIIG